MKLAIPLFRKRVSPHFGSSSKILLVETRGSAIFQEDIRDIGGEGPQAIAQNLVALGVEKLICRGIQHHYKDWLIRKGIKVLDNQRGVAKEIMIKYLKTT